MSLSHLESLSLCHQPRLSIPSGRLTAPRGPASRNLHLPESEVAGSQAAQTAMGTCPVLPGWRRRLYEVSA